MSISAPETERLKVDPLRVAAQHLGELGLVEARELHAECGLAVTLTPWGPSMKPPEETAGALVDFFSA
jgi:hypothetical protein